MCEHGDQVPVHLALSDAYPGQGFCDRDYRPRDLVKVKGVDRCLAPIVQALNDAQVKTLASCCGHGRNAGSIILGDGRELVIAADRETAEQMIRLIVEDR